jgi:hypothetical protein
MKRFKSILTALLLAVITVWSLSATAQTYSVTVIQPNGGETWAVGTSHLISWTDNLSKPVKIMLSVNGGNYQVIPGASSVTGSTWVWNIPTTQTTGTASIQVVSTVDGSIADVSNTTFSIVSNAYGHEIRIQQPNGGQSWAKGTTHLISWTSSLTGENYDISLLHFDGNNTLDHTYPIHSDVSGSTYSWTIDNSIPNGAHYKIVVKGHTTSTVTDTSDSYFSITSTPAGASVTVIQPNGNEHWVRGSQHLISWTGNLGTETYDLYLDHYNANNHKDHTYPIITNVPASTYVWTINSSQMLGSHYKVRIIGHTHHAVVDTSDHYFAITDIPSGATINLIQPSIAGISWARGTQHLISWTGNLGTETYDLYLDHYNANNHKDHTYSIVTNVPASTYVWTIDGSQMLGSHYKVRIIGHTHHAVVDTSDHYFAITDIPANAFTRVIQPNGGEQWVRGAQYVVSWTGNLGTETYDLYLDHYNANNHKDHTYPIVTNVPASTYVWTINGSQMLGSHYKVRITGHTHSTIVDTSDAYFSIVDMPQGGKITVIQPNGGESWERGKPYLISWTMENMPAGETYDIYLHHYDGTDTYDNAHSYLIQSNVAPSTYTWTIPSNNITGNNFRIYIRGHQHPAVKDSSDNYFHITMAPIIDIYPNPTAASVTVQFNENSNEHYTLTLYNRYNMRVLTQPVNTAATRQLRINTFDLPNGIYFLRLVSGKEVISRKIVVQH